MIMMMKARVLVAGRGRGRVLVLDEPLSLWGGLDAHTGEITDRRHPQSGEVVSGRVVVMPFGRGSSSASSILLQAVKEGTAPAGFVLQEADSILALGAVVAQEVYGQTLPVVVVSGEVYGRLVGLDGRVVGIDPAGGIELGDG